MRELFVGSFVPSWSVFDGDDKSVVLYLINDAVITEMNAVKITVRRIEVFCIRAVADYSQVTSLSLVSFSHRALDRP